MRAERGTVGEQADTAGLSISGGTPGLMSADEHKYISTKKKNNVECFL
jgi:hypothetical protein